MKYFGTDGIRGTYGELCVSEPFFEALGKAAAEYIRENANGKIVVGADTRASSDFLKAAFCAGLEKGNVEFEDLGVLPTPALAYAVLKRGAVIGAMITASHNPYEDNGIKFFDSQARKIEDEAQELLESKTEKFLDSAVLETYKPKKIAPRNIYLGEFAQEDYVEKMVSIFPSGFLKGLKVAIDMANGATSGISSEVFRRLGAEVFECAYTPNGHNINDGVGSQHSGHLKSFCKEVGADVGFAHDGDGDRVVVCDENASVLEGEEVMGLIAMDAKNRGKLTSSAIVTTFQSNIGMDESLRANGIEVFRCGIGDRLVMREMLKQNCAIGGENSGHYIFLEVSPCGDGLAAALSVLSVMKTQNKKLSELRGGIKMYPSESEAIKVARKTPIEDTKNLKFAMLKCEEMLGKEGRILVRYSGTEKKIRLLVEGKNSQMISESMKILKEAVEIDLQ